MLSLGMEWAYREERRNYGDDQNTGHEASLQVYGDESIPEVIKEGSASHHNVTDVDQLQAELCKCAACRESHYATL
jgi:hypothetical protein